MTRSSPADRHDSHRSLSALVRAIHAAGGDEARWPDVLERVRAHLDARVVLLTHHEFSSGADATLFESPGDAGFGVKLAQYGARIPWFLSSGDYQPGRVMTGDELIRPDELRRTDFYRDFLRPRGLLHLLCGVVDQRRRGTHVLAAYRAETQAPFEARERAELAVLLDHLTLSLHSHWRWQESKDLAQALLGLADQEAQPTLLVDADARLLYRNPAAAELLALRQGLRLDGTRLGAAHPQDQRLFAETVARLARASADGGLPPPAVLSLLGEAPGVPLIVVLRPAGPVFRCEAGTAQGLVMVAVRGARSAHDPASCLLARRYELTAAQAKVSALVFAGQSLATVARSLQLSENTVRSHLKQVFQKTDTHGQMELVHLHARVCTSLP